MNRLTKAESARFRRRLLAYIARGTSHRELASWIGCGRSTIYKIVNGDQLLRRCYADNMGKRLGINPGDLYKPSGGAAQNSGLPLLIKAWKEAPVAAARRRVANRMAVFISELAIGLGTRCVSHEVHYQFSNEPVAVVVSLASRINGLEIKLRVALNHARPGDICLQHVNTRGVGDYSGKLTTPVLTRLINKIL